MALFSRICLRRALAGVLLGVCGLCFSGYIVLDTTIHTGLLQLHSNKQIYDQSNKDKEPYDALILTYMRSGSTFIGKLLGHREDTFYWYEPLWTTHIWKFHSKGQMICDYRKDGCRNVTSGSAASVQNTLKFLLDIFNCNLKGHSNRLTEFLSATPGFAGATGQAFYNCRHPNPECMQCAQVKPKYCTNCTITKCKYTCTPEPLTDCYKKWAAYCNTTKHRVTKVLRLDTSHAKYLLENNKRLKLIQIVRDPRAVMSSRKATGWYYTGSNTPSSDAKVLCKRMENDMASAEQLKALFPGRVKVIQYEDFYDPNRTARILYDFLNMKMTDQVRSAILAPMYAENRRKSDGFHPDSYRYKFDPKSILVANKYCQKVFQSLGLRMFNSTSEIKNKTLNVFLAKIPHSLG